jgi:tetratricopeptide (TPR) repeat protein
VTANTEGQALQGRHAAYYLALAERAEPELRGPQQVQWLDRLEAEHDNLRAALAWALDQRAAEVALRLGAALRQFWEIHNHVREGGRWLEAALAAQEGAPVAAPILAKALNAAGNLALDRGDYERSHVFHEGSLALRRQLGLERDIASSLTNLGNLMAHQGHYPAAVAYYEESLALRRQLGDRWGIALVLDNLGVILVSSQGDYGRAIPFFEESLTLRRELQDQAGITRSLKHLGLARLDQGNYGVAQGLLEESLALEQALGDQSSVAESLNYLGRVALFRGDYAGAGALYRQSIKICQSLEETAGISNGLERLADLALAQDDVRRAVRLLARAAGARENSGVALITVDRARSEETVAVAQARLDQAAFVAEWAAGQAMSLEEAIADAPAPAAAGHRPAVGEAADPHRDQPALPVPAGLPSVLH